MTETSISTQGAPHAIDLLAYAEISADIAEGDRPIAEILRERSLTDEQWVEVATFWNRRMAESAQPDVSGNAEPRVALLFSEAFARAQDQKRPLVPLSVEDWAKLVHETREEGVGPALARRGLRTADYARLVRYWAKALATERALADAYDAARVVLVNAMEGV